MGYKKLNRRGQVTILVIIALIIVVLLVFIFGLLKTKSPTVISFRENPEAYIEDCVAKSLVKAEQKILDGNGYANISDNYMLYSGNKNSEKVPYFCKTSMFYTPCVNQEPMLLEKVRRELESLTKRDAAACFSEISSLIKKDGSEITEGGMNFTIDLQKKYIVADISKNFIITNGESKVVFNKFFSRIPSPLYGLIDTARNIVNYESTLCEFNVVNWERYYRDIAISRFMTGDQTKVYTLTNKDDGKQLSFAIRACVLPAGI